MTSPYAAQGYIEAKVNATPEFHPEQHVVDYSITVTPGEPYRIGQLPINDLDAGRRAKVLEVWTMNAAVPSI